MEQKSSSPVSSAGGSGSNGYYQSSKDTTFTKLFVGGLPYHTSDETLYKHFSQYGDIEEAVVIRDKTTEKSKGYGFVSIQI